MEESKGKSRPIFLAKYMLENTDDDNVVSMKAIIEAYEANGFKANRHTVADDVKALNDSGIEIMSERRGNTTVYHIGARHFELAELKMLVDAVSSSRFITKGKSDTLIEKLTRMTNFQNRPLLTSKVYTADRIKTSNTTVFVNANIVFKAIEMKKKVSFHYWNYDPNKQKILRNGGELYIASPYALIWDDDRYYLAAYSEKHGKVVTYRVDRICDASITNETAIIDEGFNPSEYARRTMKMFDGGLEEQAVTLLAENKYMQNIMDKFGDDIETEVVDNETFKATIIVRPSKTFFSWVFQFSGGIRISSPIDVVNNYRMMLQQALNGA